LTQVSSLFADHPDLLREFTYFLPDPVQDQARERLNRAARESEQRKEAQLLAQNRGGGGGDHGIHRGAWSGNGGDRGGGSGGLGSRNKPKEKRKKSSDKGHDSYRGDHMHYGDSGPPSPGSYIDDAPPRRTSNTLGQGRRHSAGPSGRKGDKARGGGGSGGGFGKGRSGGGSSKSHTLAAAAPAPRVDPERHFFEGIKETLQGVSRDAWQEFLKCVDMYSAEVFSKGEMLQLVSDLFGPNTEVFAEFRALMEGVPADKAEGGAVLTTDMWNTTPLAEIDFSQCRKCTPSYRALPKVRLLAAVLAESLRLVVLTVSLCRC
jgi:Paired amphipathic helix repeat